MTVNAGSLSVKLDLDSKTFTTDMAAATAAVSTFQRVAGKTSQLLSSLGSSFSTADIGKFASQLVTTGEEMTSLQRRLEVVTKSINRANDGFAGGSKNVQSYAETYAYLRDTALTTGSDFDDLAKSYVQLLPAAANSGIAVQDVRKSIEGTLGVGQLMGASSEQVGRAFATMRQIMSKNALQEDLRRQLDEALPHSTLILADGLTKIAGQSEDVRREFGLLGNDAQVTTAKLGKLITEGKVDGALFVRAWKEGTAEMAKFAQIANTTPSGQMNNLATIVQTNAGSFMRDSGINQWLAEITASFNAWLDGLTNISGDKARAIGEAMVDGFWEFAHGVARWADQVIGFHQAVLDSALNAITMVGKGIQLLIDNIPPLILEAGVLGLFLFGKGGIGGLLWKALKIGLVIDFIGKGLIALDQASGGLLGIDKDNPFGGVLDSGRQAVAGAALDTREATVRKHDAMWQRDATQKEALEAALATAGPNATYIHDPNGNLFGDKYSIYTRSEIESAIKRLALQMEKNEKAIANQTSIYEQQQKGLQELNRSIGEGNGGVENWVSENIQTFLEKFPSLKETFGDPGRPEGGQLDRGLSNLDVQMNALRAGNDQLLYDINNVQIDVVKRFMDSPAFAKLSQAEQQKALKAIIEAIGKFQASLGPRSQTVKVISDLNNDLREVTGAKNNDELFKLLSGPIDDTVIGKLFATTPKSQELWGNGADAKKVLQSQIIEAMKSIANIPAHYETTRERDADIGYREGELRRYGNIYKNLGGNEKDFAELQAKLADNKRRLTKADNQRNKPGLAVALGKEQEALVDRLKMSTADVDRAKRAREAFIEISGIDISGNPEIPAVNKARSALKTKEDLAVSRGELKNEDRVADRDMNELARLSVDAFLNDNAKQRGQVIAQITAMTDQQYLTAINLLDTDNRRLSILQAENQARQNGTVPAVRDQLMLEKEKLAAETNRLNVLLREDGLRGQMFANEITTINNQTADQQLRAQMMGTASWQTAQYGSDNAKVDVQLAQTYYEYSLSAEQRLQLARNEGLTTFTGAFSTAISGILSGQQSLGEGFRSMFGTITTYMIDFFAKWIAQSLVMKALGFFGNLLGGGGVYSTGGGGMATMPGWESFTGAYHSGGIVGNPSFTKSVPASVFAGAERFHTGGLLRDEVPIIAKKGEGIFTPEQMNNADSLLKSALTSQGGSGFTQNVSINVAGGAGTPEQNEDLAVRIQRALREEMRGVAANEIRQQMRPNGLLNGGY